MNIGQFLIDHMVTTKCGYRYKDSDGNIFHAKMSSDGQHIVIGRNGSIVGNLLHADHVVNWMFNVGRLDDWEIIPHTGSSHRTKVIDALMAGTSVYLRTTRNLDVVPVQIPHTTLYDFDIYEDGIKKLDALSLPSAKEFIQSIAPFSEWNISGKQVHQEKPAQQESKMIKIKIDPSVTRKIDENSLLKIADKKWRRNLAEFFMRIEHMEFKSMYDLMYKIDELMMMLCGINITFQASHYDPNTWLLTSTNDWFINDEGYTHFRITVDPQEYYEDEIAIFTFGETKMITYGS